MCRLPQLLRYFRLPPAATATDLRQAYLQRAKQVHPDVVRAGGAAGSDANTGITAKSFHELQQRFDEASALLAQREAWSAVSKQRHPVLASAGGPPSSAYRCLWDTAATGSTAADSGGATSSRKPHAAARRSVTDGVPCHGLPQSTVYTLAASTLLVVGATSFLLSQQPPRRRRSPEAASAEAGGGQRLHKMTDERKAAPNSSLGGASYPKLQSGPWSVVVAKAIPPGRGIWCPSKDFKFLDSESFYANRARGHLRAGIGQRRRLGEQQGGQIKALGYEAAHEPLTRGGVEMLPVHVAADDGNVWWLERCGADPSCRGMLSIGDTAGDTPLHHSARIGQVSTCKSLLRLGAGVDVRNEQGALPEDLALAFGHADLAALLRRVRAGLSEESAEVGAAAASEEAMRHPDGLGVLAEPPAGVVYTGLRESEPLRRAVNMAAGCDVTPPLPVSRSQQEGSTAETADRLADVVRGSLQGTEFMLDESTVAAASEEDIFVEAHGAAPELGGTLVSCGLLLYEAPGEVSADAPGHWAAVRQAQGGGPRAAPQYWRLDPVRGPFRLDAAELRELVGRYRTWRLVCGPSHLRAERAAKLASAKEEAVTLIRKRGDSGAVLT